MSCIPDALVVAGACTALETAGAGGHLNPLRRHDAYGDLVL
jgi:hypothetical protein